jgi:hypothetical protein
VQAGSAFIVIGLYEHFMFFYLLPKTTGEDTEP